MGQVKLEKVGWEIDLDVEVVGWMDWILSLFLLCDARETKERTVDVRFRVMDSF